jgi:hypothetical protein
MRDLSAQTGIGADGNYLNGNLVDNQTLVGEGINQDLVQFFQKLADLASITFNDLPDNETNGYQLIEALETVVRSFAATTGLKGTVEKATQQESDDGDADKFPDAAAIKSSRDDAILAALANQEIFIQKIGAWNMNNSGAGSGTTAIPFVPPANKSVIIQAVMIYDDSNNAHEPLNFSYNISTIDGGFRFNNFGSTAFQLSARTGGNFDNAAHSSVAINRGFILYSLIDEDLTP